MHLKSNQSTGDLSLNCRLELDGGELVRNNGGEEIPSVHSSPRRLLHLNWAPPPRLRSSLCFAQELVSTLHPHKSLSCSSKLVSPLKHRSAFSARMFSGPEFMYQFWNYIRCCRLLFNLEHCLCPSQSFGELQLGFSPAINMCSETLHLHQTSYLTCCQKE